MSDDFDWWSYEVRDPTCSCFNDGNGMKCILCGEDICTDCQEFYGGFCESCAEKRAPD